MGLMPEIVV